jgi:hypothetical protein
VFTDEVLPRNNTACLKCLQNFIAKLLEPIVRGVCHETSTNLLLPDSGVLFLVPSIDVVILGDAGIQCCD